MGDEGRRLELELERQQGRPSIQDPADIPTRPREVPEMRRREDIELDRIMEQEEALARLAHKSGKKARARRAVLDRSIEEARQQLEADNAQRVRNIQDYGRFLTASAGVIALGHLGFTVYNHITARSADELYDDDPVVISKSASTRVLRSGVEENLTPEQRKTMETMAKAVDVVYRRRKIAGPFRGFEFQGGRQQMGDVKDQDFDGYRIDTSVPNDLVGRFVNDDTREIILAMRGLLPVYDVKDTMQLPAMIRATALEAHDEDEFGDQFDRDIAQLERVLDFTVGSFPDYNIVLTGHSRGGRAVMTLGRERDMEFHAFSPAANRGDVMGADRGRDGNIYYHYLDPVSTHMHRHIGKDEEQHHIAFNNRFYTHSITDFMGRDNTRVVRQPVRRDPTRFELIGEPLSRSIDMRRIASVERQRRRAEAAVLIRRQEEAKLIRQPLESGFTQGLSPAALDRDW